MFEHWFVIGSQVNTKIFTQGEGKLNLKVLKVLNNPLGRERSRNLHGIRSSERPSLKTYNH
jgi:hypothetical protein